MSLTSHLEIERVGRVGRECHEDASDLSATSRACRARGIWRTTRHTDKRAAYTAADRRPTSGERHTRCRQKLLMNKPIYAGMAILDLAKTVVYQFHYH